LDGVWDGVWDWVWVAVGFYAEIRKAALLINPENVGIRVGVLLFYFMRIQWMLAVVYVLMAGCTTTHIVRSWRAPNVTVDSQRLQKVMVVALIKDEASRRIAEDKMASYHSAFRVSYNDFNSKEVMGDEKRWRVILKKQRFDGILTLRLVARENEQVYVPGNYVPGWTSGGYGAYHRTYYSGYYMPGYYRTDVKYWIEVTVFSLKRDRLLWSGVASTLNPSRLDKTVGEVLDEVRKQMLKDGFLTE
jgi:hypothetical protein